MASSRSPAASTVTGVRAGARIRRCRLLDAQEALRSTTFWRLTAVDGLRMLAMSSVGIFRVPFFIDDKGLDAHVVAFSLSAEAVFAVLVSLPTGWAVDRYQPRYVAAVSTVLMIAGFLLTMTASSIVHVFAATSVFGLGIASFIICQNSVWPAYFGHANIGCIRGASDAPDAGLRALSARRSPA